MKNILSNKMKLAGFSLLIITILLTIFYSKLVSYFSSLGIAYFDRESQTGQYIVLNMISIIKYSFGLFIILLFLLGVFLLFNLQKPVLKFIRSIIDLKALARFLLDDTLLTKTNFNLKVFVFSVILSVLIHIRFLLFKQPQKEGILELLTSSLFLASSVILIIAVLVLWQKQRQGISINKLLIIYLIVMSLFLLFVFGEEISWGQHYLNFETSDFFKRNNFQNEVNIHNFINPVYWLIYPVFGILFFIFLNLLWFFPLKEQSLTYKILTPHPSLYYVAMMIVASSFTGENEVFEEFLAIFLLFYSLRIYSCIRSIHYV
ncbi:MAG: hypothetical protein K9G58_10590 [Bacteroidales bacterium]|nr:hypothetical protein [Bacteroidales bacterium]MCF8386546.1 hypothetical protein [Bacteroidales bacterium]MCF8398609.1 hypothetical protein [Bacteroidales bacterium]